MREIKFRVWSILDKKIYNLNDEMVSIPYYEIFCKTPDSRAFEVMQYTGIKDKNGKEIYEGDILMTWNIDSRTGKFYRIKTLPSIHVKAVRWNDEIKGWNFRRGKSKHPIEVIGNIYENPELLKGYKNEN